jgi:hypothetical protein
VLSRCPSRTVRPVCPPSASCCLPLLLRPPLSLSASCLTFLSACALPPLSAPSLCLVSLRTVGWSVPESILQQVEENLARGRRLAEEACSRYGTAAAAHAGQVAGVCLLQFGAQ